MRKAVWYHKNITKNIEAHIVNNWKKKLIILHATSSETINTLSYTSIQNYTLYLDCTYTVYINWNCTYDHFESKTANETLLSLPDLLLTTYKYWTQCASNVWHYLVLIYSDVIHEVSSFILFQLWFCSVIPEAQQIDFLTLLKQSKE